MTNTKRAAARFTPGILICILLVTMSRPLKASVATQQAEDRADRAIGGHHAWVYKGHFFDKRRDTIGLLAADADVDVDAETGILIHYYYRAPYAAPAPGAVEVGMKAARSSAEAFLARSGVSLQEWTLDRLQHYDRGTMGQTYGVGWKKYYYGVRMPSRIDAEVDAWTGAVVNYTLIDDPLTISIQPHITVQQAAALVAARVGFNHPSVQRAELAVWYTSSVPGPERLYWSFDDMSDTAASADPRSHVMAADVDAVTGQVVNIFVPMAYHARGPAARLSQKNGAPSHEKQIPVRIVGLRAPLAIPPHAAPPLTTFEAAAKRAQSNGTVSPKGSAPGEGGGNATRP